MDFGKRLKELRKEKGYSLRSLAEKVGLDFTYLSKVENSRVGYTPSAKKIRELAQALETDELELLELANKVPPELEALTGNPSARIFLRRAKSLVNQTDWDDLLRYLDQKRRPRRKPNGDTD